jgi:hypothetical protein
MFETRDFCCPCSNVSFVIFLASVLAPKVDFSNHEPSEYDRNCTSKLLGDIPSPHDMKRLEAYSNNLVDYHLVRNNSLRCRICGLLHLQNISFGVLWKTYIMHILTIFLFIQNKIDVPKF